MKHIIIGGNGFTGRYLAERLLGDGESVLICDIERDDSLDIYRGADYLHADITHDEDVARIPIGPDDVVHHMAARQFHLDVPNRDQDGFFQAVNTEGTARVLAHMERSACPNLIYYSTDMVYGLPDSVPVPPDHPRRPIGPYGLSKYKSEQLCEAQRARGMKITIFRPRLILGPGRLGVLAKLFRAIEKNLPVPLIGNGANQYQMISVFDCVDASMAALARGIPNGTYNLGSANPPSVHALLSKLIDSAGSRSFLLKTPAGLTKLALRTLEGIGLPVLYKEQYTIADVDYLVDIAQTRADLGWQPAHSDEDMMFAAFEEYQRLARERAG
ncbi:MAG: NAD-dependent epimerase/dehydratase family protein [Gammaproteobacteria bacterium]